MDIKTLEEMMARGESHAGNLNTPIRQDAFELTNEEKIELIAKNFRQIMLTLGLDLEDDSLKGTPMRVAKMYVEEIFSGLNPANLPKATLFENDYRQMLVEKNITVHSMCEHHFVPIVGYAHVAYISSGQVIGLSKINRIVRHFGRRPQVQERLTREIANHLRQVLNTEDVAVVIDAKHYCVAMRGIEDQASTTITAEYTGAFQDPDRKREFLQHIAHTA
jgi:GTP cyclohydrolase I